MVVKKAGTILLNKETKQIGMVYREEDHGYTFPKGHLEVGETLEECAVRETEEETMYSNHLLLDKPIGIINYQNLDDGDVEVHYYISISDGETKKEISENDKEVHEWVDLENVENKLTYSNLIELWDNVKEFVKNVFENDCRIDGLELPKIS